MLTDQSSIIGPHSRAQVAAAMQTRTKRSVFFLDEFKFAHGVEMPMERRRRQSMVAVFRSFGLPVTISSVDATERAGEYQRYTDSGVVCMMFPTFPHVQDPRIDILSKEFRVVIENSRPHFANLALKYLDEHPFGATNGPLLVEFMDAMTGELAQQFTEHKHQFFIRFCTYQFMLFLAASYVRGWGEACPHSMRLHFGQMAESSPFELCSQRFDSVYKAGESP